MWPRARPKKPPAVLSLAGGALVHPTRVAAGFLDPPSPARLWKRGAGPLLGPVPFPIDIAALGPPGFVAGLSATELGAYVMLALYSWSQVPPGSLPTDNAQLVVISRTRAEEWQAARPRLLLVFRPGEGDRLYNETIGNLHASALTRLERQRAGGRVGAERSGRGIQGPPEVNPRSTQGQPPFRALNSKSLTLTPALALERSKEESANPSAQQDLSVVAELGARARALKEQKLSEWKIEQAKVYLQDAIVRWTKAGLTDYPIRKCTELAQGPHSSPARVNAVIEYADDMIAAAAAKGQKARPVGVLIKGLGLNREGRVQPAEVPIVLERKWNDLENRRRELLGTVAAIEAATKRRLEEARNTTARPSAG